MKTLIYYAFKGTSFTSKMTKSFTRSDLSHIAIWDKEKNNLIEAKKIGLIMKLEWGWSHVSNHKEGTTYEEWHLQVPDDIWDSCMNTYRTWAENSHPYDWQSIFGFLLRRQRDDKDGDCCSEGAMRPLAKAMNWDKINPAFVSPADFVNLIQSANGRLFEVRTV